MQRNDRDEHIQELVEILYKMAGFCELEFLGRKKVNRENCFYNDAQWDGNYGKIFEKWKHDGTPYDINSVMHYAAHICSHNSEPVLVDKKTGGPVKPGKQETNSLSGHEG